MSILLSLNLILALIKMILNMISVLLYNLTALLHMLLQFSFPPDSTLACISFGSPQTFFSALFLNFFKLMWHLPFLFCAQTGNSPFRRVREEEIRIDPRLTNNSFESKVNHNLLLQKWQTKATHGSVTFRHLLHLQFKLSRHSENPRVQGKGTVCSNRMLYIIGFPYRIHVCFVSSDCYSYTS
jgi:hypothetical protein